MAGIAATSANYSSTSGTGSGHYTPIRYGQSTSNHAGARLSDTHLTNKQKKISVFC